MLKYTWFRVLDEESENGGGAPSTQGGENGGDGTQTPEQPGNVPAQPTEYEIDGQKLTADQIRDLMKVQKDYQALQPEFTRKSQALSKLIQEGLIDEHGNVVRKENGKPDADPFADKPEAKEAVKVLKELGFITKEEAAELRKELDALKNNYQSEIETKQLNDVSNVLASKYDGKKGEPKFDLAEIQTKVTQDPSLIRYVQDEKGNFLVDLEQTYRNVHADFWGALPEMKAKVVKTERGAQIQTTTPTKEQPADTEDAKIASAVSFFKGKAQD